MAERTTITSKDGTRLSLHRWTAANARATLLVVHGYCEHGERYSELAEALGARGIETWSLDLRGHGRSEGRRGLIVRFDEYLDDVDAAVAAINAQRDGLAHFVLGHSNGGLTAFVWAVQRSSAASIRGLVLTNPFMGIALAVPAWKVALARALARVKPSFSLPAGLDPAMLSHNEASNHAYKTDPLIFRNATAGWFVEVVRVQRALESCGPLAMPALFVIGEDDGVASPAASRAVYDRLHAPEKTWKGLPGQYHEVLNEPWRADTFALIGDFIEGHVGER